MSSTKAFVKTGKLDHASVQCVGDRILVRRDEKEDTSRGGIALPEAAKQKPSKGTIVSVGPGKILDSGIRKEPQVKEGDRVLFGRWSGTEHPDDEMLVFIREDDIQAVI